MSPSGVFAALLLIGLCHVSLQQDCSDLPTNSELESLISENFKESDAATPPTVTIFQVNYVCLMSGMFRGTYRGFSAVVLYNCSGIQCPASNLSQFEFSCGKGAWINSVEGSDENLRTDVADANLTSPARTDCSVCVSPSHIILQDNPGLQPMLDDFHHCLPCDEACNQGDMRCFGFGNDNCCNFYDPSSGRCLNECPADREPNEDFNCTGLVSFAETEYVFSEEDGFGIISVEGTAGITVRVVGGPNRDVAGVVTSGTDINMEVTVPVDITFQITNDDVALEAEERFPVVIISDDPTVTVEEPLTNIFIRDDFDSVRVGFESIEVSLQEGNTTGLRVRVIGERVRDFNLNLLQARPGEAARTTSFTVPAGDENTVIPPITNPDDDVALQDVRTYILSLTTPSDVGNVILGGMGVFSQANITVLDNDSVTVSFVEEMYTVLESESVDITLSLDHGIARGIVVQVTAVQSGLGVPPLLQPSRPLDSYQIDFTANDLPQTQTFTLTPVDDTNTSEPVEMALLVFQSVSDLAVQRGPEASLVIVDDDELGEGVSFSAPVYMFSENEGRVTVTVNGPSNFPSGLSVQISGGPGRQPGAVVTSGMSVNAQLTSFPVNVSFDITDDTAALEPEERYQLFLNATDPSITISQDTAEIVIVDDDIVLVGFPYNEKSFLASEAEDANATVTVFGQAQQEFTLNFLQEGGPSRSVNFDAGIYLGTERQLPLTIPEDIVEDIVFEIGLVSRTDGMVVGGLVRTEGSDAPDLDLFPVANISVMDDAVIVGFLDPEYTFPEGNINTPPSVRIGRSGTLPFTVNLTSSPALQQFIEPSAVPGELAGTITFTTASNTVNYDLDLRNDNVALEDDEVVTLTLSSPSTRQVRVGGNVDGVEYYPTARVTVQDDDVVMIGFGDTTYSVGEERPFDIEVRLFNDIVSGRSATVSVAEQSRGNMQFVMQSFAVPPNSLTFTSSERVLSVRPDVTNDAVGLEDDEQVVLTLVSSLDPALIQLQPNLANVTISDDDIVTLSIVGDASRRVLEGDTTDICVSKDIVSVRATNFVLRPLPGTAQPEDYSPTTDQSGALLGFATSTTPACFTFLAVDDSLPDGGEMFRVLLTSADGFPTGPGGLQLERNSVTITIVEPTTSPPPDSDVEDTVVGDPLFTVPISGSQHLCYEIRGRADEYFNFISDECVSVNAHYTEQGSLPGETRPLHVVDEIAIRAVDNEGKCIDILVDRNGCLMSVNNEQTDEYSEAGVTANLTGNRVTVSVPNCEDMPLEMEVVCETRSGIEMIRFEVTRGLNLRETSHGLIGQFWNVSITTQEFTGNLRGASTPDDLVLVTLVSPSSVRTFPAWLQTKTWDNRKTCLYGGNQNGGTVYEVLDDHDSVIEGIYRDYITESAFSTVFKFSHFNTGLCS